MSISNIRLSAKKIKISLVLLSTLLLINCGGGGSSSDDKGTASPKVNLSVSPSTISFDEAVNTESLTITTTSNWSATNNVDWLSLSATSGSNNSTLDVNVIANDSALSRSAEISITAGTTTKIVSITQNPGVFADLLVSSSSLTIHPAGESQSFQITTQESWTINNDSDWLSLSIESGTGNATVTTTALENSKGNARNVTLTVNAGSLSKNVKVSQDNIDLASDYDISPDLTGMRDINSTEFTDLMGVGFNIGNSLEAIGSETAWGNPKISKALVDAIKNAGFKSIRLPVAWSQFSDADNFIIKREWLNRVEEVVNYALDNDMYVMMNIHWDGGWMQPTNDEKVYVNNRLAIMWQQIATHFRDYDDHLLFAGTNEVMVEGDYNTPTQEYYTVQNSFNQTFVNTVRKTGGRNVYRQLIVQGFNTNIDHTVNFAVIPEDETANRLMMEVHYYDPYNFALNENSNITQWGGNATDESKTESWAHEEHTDAQFIMMRENFYDKGIGVILGEYGAISRTEISDHEQYRVDWNKYITEAAIANKMVPFYWDNGSTGNHTMGLFNRETAEEVHVNVINVLTNAAL